MEATKAKVRDLCELKEKLMCSAKEAISRGMQNVDTHEMGAVTDMIKDLAEAEEKCWKACYYKMMVEDMKKDTDEMEREGYKGGRMGYDNWRYSSGRFAPTGRGHYDRAGFMPGEKLDEPWMMAEGFGDSALDRMMGYSDGSRGGSSSHSSPGSQNGSSYGSSMGSNDRMGYPRSERGDRYDRWSKARMGYHESKDATSKERMDATAREYVVDMAEAVKEVWKDADPAMRKEIKNKFVALTGEMN